MIPELGSFALVLALTFSLIQWVAPLLGFYRKNQSFFDLQILATIGQFIFLSAAMFFLIISFIKNDMTVLFVRQHSHHLLPFIYRVGAAWGGHEGSLLLWCLILSAWTLALVIFSGRSLGSLFYKIQMILGFISMGFILFTYATSNPFQRDFPTQPIVGDDLTPLLQDPGLIFHPPMLYLGYVGFAIGFAFAIAALIEGKLDSQWAKACRPWIILPWFFLGCGIILGSWWAYRELGWGGWWFWDPVENASLLPWLVATALIHSLIVTEKRDVFKGWSVLLALIAFCLSLIGTFLVRSGVLVSVHTFASDPTRGIFLLSYLALLMIGAFLLYAFRINTLYQPPRFQLFSRETFLLLNSVMLLSAMLTIIIGTLYPIMLDAFNLEKISVGEPYFNTVFFPIMLPLLLLMGLAPHVRWGKENAQRIWLKLRGLVFLSMIIGIGMPIVLGYSFHVFASVGIALAAWIMLSTLQPILKKERLSLSKITMIIAHIGVAIMVLGIAINLSYSEERQVKILPGESIALAHYQFTFENITQENHNNYKSLTALFSVNKANHRTKTITAEERIYLSHEQTLSRPGIESNLFRDLYIGLGSVFPDGAWSIRIYYKPFVRWIWLGGFILLMGGLIGWISRAFYDNQPRTDSGESPKMVDSDAKCASNLHCSRLSS